MQKITTFLWFDTQAEEAARHYTSVFANSRITDVRRYGKAGPREEGTVMTVTFELEGQQFIALNGGPEFTFNEAISLFVDCATQEEVDDLWAKLTDGGAEGQCGWLRDKFGLAWQIVPRQLMEMTADPDPAKSDRVIQAMLGMRKLDIQGLKDAYEG
ncbi:VOC family protein [Streptomyces sp. NPDC003077]|uniref:VOC family protein n=1 Tax=Streptomyces sp. NPDC003077 TaxID=3154443 RepID=UPI0033B7C70D